MTFNFKAWIPRSQTVKMAVLVVAACLAVFLIMHIHGALAEGTQTGATEYSPDFSPNFLTDFAMPQQSVNGGRTTNF